MSEQKNLIFFDKEGDYLNFNYDIEYGRYEGDLIFHENSSDTFKTIGLYMFEKVEPVEITDSSLFLNKFQLFNEYGVDFLGTKYYNSNVTKVETSNNDSNFFSKWIYGDNFESKFKIGSEIRFDTPIADFTNPNQTYTVVNTKKGSIMILSNVDNNNWNTLYKAIVESDGYLDDVTISGVNCIKVHKYIDSSYNLNLSDWSEPYFYDKLFDDQKLSIVNTESNDSVVTVKSKSLIDNTYFTYNGDVSGVGVTSSLLIELVLNTDVPKIYNDFATFDSVENKLTFGTGGVPIYLRPGVQFKVPSSINNTNFYTVGDIIQFDNSPGKVYATFSQVLYMNDIYHCIQSYTQSTPPPFSTFNSSGVSPYLGTLSDIITPDNLSYWVLSDFIPVSETVVSETIFAEVYLTNNVIYFNQDFDTSIPITISSAIDRYKDSFNYFNIDLLSDLYNDSNIIANLQNSSLYAEVNFYDGYGGSNLTNIESNYEKLIETKEELVNEKNNDISKKYSNNIVFTDVDEFGVKITINSKIYFIETSFFYNGVNIDMDRTIDKTLRDWKDKYYLQLLKLGILVELKFSGFGSSIYSNTINLSTWYPNVPISFNIQLGTTADYHIEDKYIIFYDIGNILNILINGKSYIQNFNISIEQTLTDWINSHKLFLLDSDIIANSSNQILYLDTKQQDTRLSVEVRLGKSFKPGELLFEIIDRKVGNVGSIITSNEIITNDINLNLEEVGLSTGQIISSGNSFFTLNNQEYNVLFLDPDKITLSYQGPFWGNTQSSDILSGFLGFGFDIGFGYDPSAQNITSPITPTYSVSYYNTTTNLSDLVYIQPTEEIEILGNDVSVMNANTSFISNIISLGSTQSIKMIPNPINNTMYLLTYNYLFAIDPIIDMVVGTVSLGSIPYDMTINESNGDIYVSYENSNLIQVWDSNDILVSSINASTYSNALVYNDLESDIYSANVNESLRIDGVTRNIKTTIGLTSSNSSLFYNPFNGYVYGFDSNSLYSIKNGNISYLSSVPSGTFSSFVFDINSDNMYISVSDNNIYEVDGLNNISTYNISDYGHLVISSIDSNIYISSMLNNSVVGYNTSTNSIFTTIPLTSKVTKMIYNPLRNSINAVSPTTDQVVEIMIKMPSLGLTSSYSVVSNYLDSVQLGSLDPDMVKVNTLLITSREFIRRPRSNFETDGDVKVEYRWEFEDDQNKDIFIYDFSGDQLQNNTPLSYIGDKPLPTVYLNNEANTDINRVSDPKFQQTIFDSITYTLDYIDSSDNISFVPEPMQTFIGFNSVDEGTSTSVLLLKRIENIKFDIVSSLLNNNIITFTKKIDNDTGLEYGEISLDVNSTAIFTGRNLKEGQYLQLFIKDNINIENQFISFNNGKIFKIRNIHFKTIIVDFLEDTMVDENTIINNYPNINEVTYLTTTFKVSDKEIGRFKLYGQTEVEDIRFKIELDNVGKNLNPEDAFIFKSYDINEHGVDWTFLNKKRKELLSNKQQIYDFIGSYKAIVNAINLFGYNELELYEYYRNVNRKSTNFNKLFKVEIPDIFDNSVEGWTVNDVLDSTLPNNNYESTNLFNLTYRITDKDGNNKLLFSLDEVIVKLNGLKHWLEKNVVPLTHNILDITGRSDTSGSTYIQHENYDIKIIKMNNDMTPVNFFIDETYTLPVNTGSSVYTVSIRFETKDNFDPDYFSINIRTYQIYPEWIPLVTYTNGDLVRYFGKLYKSVNYQNKLNNPTEYENSPDWQAEKEYVFGQIVKYNNRYYQYSVLTKNLLPSPSFNNIPPSNPDWLDISNWVVINMSPVQNIQEYRSGDLLPFNFTIDTNIDPYVIVEVTSDNGYGQNYTVKKSVEIRVDADSKSLIIGSNLNL